MTQHLSEELRRAVRDTPRLLFAAITLAGLVVVLNVTRVSEQRTLWIISIVAVGFALVMKIWPSRYWGGAGLFSLVVLALLLKNWPVDPRRVLLASLQAVNPWPLVLLAIASVSLACVLRWMWVQSRSSGYEPTASYRLIGGVAIPLFVTLVTLSVSAIMDSSRAYYATVDPSRDPHHNPPSTTAEGPGDPPSFGPSQPATTPTIPGAVYSDKYSTRPGDNKFHLGFYPPSIFGPMDVYTDSGAVIIQLRDCSNEIDRFGKGRAAWVLPLWARRLNGMAHIIGEDDSRSNVTASFRGGNTVQVAMSGETTQLKMDLDPGSPLVVEVTGCGALLVIYAELTP